MTGDAPVLREDDIKTGMCCAVRDKSVRIVWAYVSGIERTHVSGKIGRSAEI